MRSYVGLRLVSDLKGSGDSITYGYDEAGNRTSLTLTPAGENATVTRFGYDALNRLDSVTDSNNQITTYGYDNVGNRATVSYPNGNTTDYSYDALNRLTQLTTTDASNNTLVDYQYTLDDSGHRTRIEEHSGRITDYIYDDLYRLTHEDITDIVNGNYSAIYDYDNVGNRTDSTINGISTVYSYDDNDRLTQQGGETYGYDDNGNTTSKTIDGETSSYTYDVKNQLNRATLVNGGITTNTSYRYDIDGIRIQKIENTDTTEYLVDHNRDYAQVLKETNQTTSQSLNYLYGDDLISQSQDNTSERYYLYDGLGSTRVLTDNTGTTTDSYDYEAFGSTLNQTGTTQNNYLFTGEQYDHTLDQQYIRARYYNHSIGRFTQQDSWMGNSSDPQSLHKYLYTHSDPINNLDPTGHINLPSISSTLSIAGTLATTAFAFYDIYQFSTGDKEFNAVNAGWTAVVLVSGPVAGKVLKGLSLKRRQKILESAIKSETIGKLFVRGGRTSEDTLRKFIPGKTQNTFKSSTTIKSGYKYDFEVAGVKIQIKWHSPDMNAAAKYPGSNSGSGWTAQIKIKNKYVGTDGKLYRNSRSNHTHIPIEGL